MNFILKRKKLLSRSTTDISSSKSGNYNFIVKCQSKMSFVQVIVFTLAYLSVQVVSDGDGSNNAITFSGTTATNQNSTLAQVPTRLRKFRLTVSTFQDYQFTMRNPPNNSKIIVKVELDSPFKWPLDSEMVNAEKINKLELSGPFTLDIIPQILNQTVNLESLSLTNKNNRLCARNKGQLHILRMMTYLENPQLDQLKELSLNEFNGCMEVFEMLAGHLSIKYLEKFENRNGTVSQENLEQIYHILQSSRDSLTNVNFSETKWELSLVSSHMDYLPKVENLRMNFLSNTNSTDSTINYLGGNEFHRVFPNLKRFESEKGYLPWNQVPNILHSHNLQHLQLAIDMKENRTYFKLSFLRHKLPNLEGVKLNLRFESCDLNGEQYELRGLETLKSELKSVSVSSNCVFRASYPAAFERCREERVESYSRRNGIFTFAFNLIS